MTVSTHHLKRYRDLIEAACQKKIAILGPKSPLRDACAYALATGGKRVRPALVLMIADALNEGADASYAALAIEFFHTASLVADDMPSMDDDDFRRDKPSVHKQFGEGAALLVTYALIAGGYDCLRKNAEVVRQADLPFSGMSDRLCVLALENVAYNTGLNGATGGQFMDIAPADLSLPTIKEIIHKKTSSLFEISFVLGWLYGGGDPARLSEVKEAAAHFGLAFQIADDLGDMEQDVKNGRQVNTANLFGEDEARRMFQEEHAAFLLKMRRLGILSPAVLEVAAALQD